MKDPYLLRFPSGKCVPVSMIKRGKTGSLVATQDNRRIQVDNERLRKIAPDHILPRT